MLQVPLCAGRKRTWYFSGFPGVGAGTLRGGKGWGGGLPKVAVNLAHPRSTAATSATAASAATTAATTTELFTFSSRFHSLPFTFVPSHTSCVTCLLLFFVADTQQRGYGEREARGGVGLALCSFFPLLVISFFSPKIKIAACAGVAFHWVG